LERELRGFLAGRSEWPTYREFADSGRARLFAQIMSCGGPYYWGHRFGLRVRPYGMRWNRERVRAALTPFLKDRAVWPGDREFAEAGMTAVYRAAQQHGGISYWAEQFGFTYGQARTLRWPKERIGKELAAFNEGRSDFPRRSEFYAAGRRALYTALSKRDGVSYWAKRLKLAQQRPGPAPRRRRSPPIANPQRGDGALAGDSRQQSGARALLQILHPAGE
jgi:hypothetical protein